MLQLQEHEFYLILTHNQRQPSWKDKYIFFLDKHIFFYPNHFLK